LLFVPDEDPLAGSDPGRKSHFPRRFSYNATPNRFSIDRSVVSLMSSRLAAPSAPDNTPFVSRKTRSQFDDAVTRRAVKGPDDRSLRDGLDSSSELPPEVRAHLEKQHKGGRHAATSALICVTFS